MGLRLRRILTLVVLAALLCGAWFGWESWRLNQLRSALTEVVQSTDLDALLRGEEPASTQPATPESANQTPDQAESGAIGTTAGEKADEASAMKSPDSEPSTSAPAPDADVNPVDLALRNILLSQGEQGLELWRLQANWATLRQESGLVEVRDPNVRYALGDPQGERDGKPYFADDQFVTVTSRTGRVTDNNTRITLEGNVRSEYQGDVLTGPVAIFNNADRTLLYPQGADLAGARVDGFAHVLRWNMATNTLEGEQGVTVIWTPEAPNEPAEAPALP